MFYRVVFGGANLKKMSLVMAAAMLAICLLALVETTEVAEAEDSLPENGKIAYSDGASIYVVNSDGTGRTYVAPDDASTSTYVTPAWSPDGTKIAFSGNMRICVMDADGSHLRCLTDNSTDDTSPAWSSDGTKIAYTGYGEPGHGFEIYTVNADGSDQTRLTNNRERDEDINSDGELTRWRENLDPAWSPDGKKIAFGVDATHGRSGIYVMKPDGSNQTLVIAGGDQPDWSPDGSKIAYRREYPGQRNTDISVANADGSNPVNLTGSIVGIFLMGCAFLLVVGCSRETGSQPTGSQKSEVSQSAETGSEHTGSRESESTHELTHELVLHGESIERTPNSPNAFLLKVNGITYDNPDGIELPGNVLHDEDLGPKVADVSPEMNRESTNPTTTYSALPDEVPLYAIKGYDPSFRVAARMDTDLRGFEVLYSPRAEEGSDVLDIGGKVRSISIFHWKFSLAGGGVGYIEDPGKAQQAVQSLMDAPLKTTGPDYFFGERHKWDHYGVQFNLKDGTSVSLEYRMDTGRLSKDPPSGVKTSASGIVTPQAFRQAIEGSVEKRLLKAIELEKAESRSCSDTRRSQVVRSVNSEGGPPTPRTAGYTTNDVSPGGPWGGVLRGTGEKDMLIGEGGEDEIYGLGGDDTVEGGACDDEIHGGPGNDNMAGDQPPAWAEEAVKPGKDVLYGEDGNDTLFPDKDGQRDELYCGKGYDVAEVGSATTDKIDYVDDSCEEKEEFVPLVP